MQFLIIEYQENFCSIFIELLQSKAFQRLVASTKCKIALVETALCLAHADNQMLEISLYVLLGHICPLSKNGHKFLNFRKFETKKDLNVFVFITFDKKIYIGNFRSNKHETNKKTARFEKKNFFASSVILNAMDFGEGTFISVKKIFFQLNIYSC